MCILTIKNGTSHLKASLTILFLLVPAKRFALVVEVSYLYNILYHTSLFSIDCCLSDLYPLSDDLTTDGQFYMTLKRSHCFF